MKADGPILLSVLIATSFFSLLDLLIPFLTTENPPLPITSDISYSSESFRACCIIFARKFDEETTQEGEEKESGNIWWKKIDKEEDKRWLNDERKGRGLE